MSFCQQGKNPAHFEVFGANDVAVEQDNWWPGSRLKVMELKSIDRHEAAARWMPPLRLFRSIQIVEGHCRHYPHRRGSAYAEFRAEWRNGMHTSPSFKRF
jgi:hypothetical protein